MLGVPLIGKAVQKYKLDINMFSVATFYEKNVVIFIKSALAYI